MEAQDAFFAARRTRKDSPHTTAAYRRDLAVVGAQLAELVACSPAELALAHLTPGNLRAAFGQFADTHARSSISRAWSTWNQFLTFCVVDGMLAGNPIGAVAKPDVPQGYAEAVARRRHSRAVAERGRGGPQGARSVAGAGCAGVRAGSGGRVAVDRDARAAPVVDRGRPGDQRLHVRGKGWRERSVPIERPLETGDRALSGVVPGAVPARSGSPTRHALLLAPSGAPIGRGALEYLVRSCYRSAGIHDRVPSGASLHALRHTFATRLAEDGANATEIMTLLGHATLTTSQNYIEATGRERRAAAASNRTYRALDGLSDPD